MWVQNGCGSKPMGSHFGVGAPPILVYFSGDWDVHWGYGILTHGHCGCGSKIGTQNGTLVNESMDYSLWCAGGFNFDPYPCIFE